MEHTMEPGHIYVINPNELHSTFDRGGLYYYCLIVDDEFLSQSGVNIQRMEIETVVCDSLSNRVFDEIICQMEAAGPYYAPRVRGLVLLLLSQLLEQHGKRPHGQSPRLHDPDAPIKLAVDFIKANYARKLTLEEIAAEAGFSKQYFANRFKKSIGMTVVAYINLVRCRKAKKLLVQKKMSVLQVANQCGFDNASYFSKTFREVMGVLPSEIRAQDP